MKLIELSGLELAKLIKKRKVSSNEIVIEHIQQVKKVNPALNAMVADRFDKALNESKKHRPVSSQVYSGVPCSIKECFAVEGMPQSSGLFSRKDYRSDRNATAVSRYKKAGAIILGVTNTSELCMWMESNNKVYGRTSNPYDLKRTVGGSSGGEAAISAAGGAPFGLGSDIGGSIRMPAFFNGIFGHKPSSKVVPNSGQYPVAKGLAGRYLTTGPLCRKAEDLLPLMQILQGPGEGDDDCKKVELHRKVDYKKLKVLIMSSNRAPLESKVSFEMREKILQAGIVLEQHGAGVEEVYLSAFKKSFDIWSSMLYEGNTEAFYSLMSDGQKINFFWELIKSTWGGSQFTVPGIILALTEQLPRYMKKHTKAMIEAGNQLRYQLNEILDENTVLLFPPYVAPAPRHNKPLLPPFNWVYTAIINVLELPVTQVPLGLSPSGLPLGVQVIGGHGNDALTIALANLLEKEFGGWVPPEPWF